IFSLLFGFLAFSNPSTAQFEAGVMGGLSNYAGDITNQNAWFAAGDYNAALAFFGRYTVHPLVALRLGFNYTSISAADNKTNDGFRLDRNLSFRSKIYEVAFIAEFNILGYQPYNLQRPWSPYVFAGVAGYYFNPQAQLDGVYYDLQPLGTEGQGLDGYEAPYNLTQVSFPIGGGVKYALNDQWNIGLELGGRKTLTDYLDDVSGAYVDDAVILEAKGATAAALANRSGTPKNSSDNRGNPDGKDWYLIGGITISYNFTDNGLVGSRGRSRGGKKGCPTNF
ncbi:MAG: outer membrane beta-barrel protein, partial [Saprospiraceae bacterium]|nr:outer membrane beta-barrel protein [Saprospiraceae bacterium]